MLHTSKVVNLVFSPAHLSPFYVKLLADFFNSYSLAFLAHIKAFQKQTFLPLKADLALNTSSIFSKEVD